MARDDVIVQNCLQPRRVLEQASARVRRKLLECLLGRSKNSEGALRGQRIAKTCSLDAGGEGREIARTNHRVDDVLRGCRSVVPGGVASRNALCLIHNIYLNV